MFYLKRSVLSFFERDTPSVFGRRNDQIREVFVLYLAQTQVSISPFNVNNAELSELSHEKPADNYPNSRGKHMYSPPVLLAFLAARRWAYTENKFSGQSSVCFISGKVIYFGMLQNFS